MFTLLLLLALLPLLLLLLSLPIRASPFEADTRAVPISKKMYDALTKVDKDEGPSRDEDDALPLRLPVAGPRS